MDSFELNKVIGALLATVFVVFSVGIVSDAMFAAPVPENPGYAIEAAEVEEGMEAGGEPAALEPIGPLLANADVGAGEALFKRCAACHTAEQGGANKVGPNLWEVVNRPIASHEGFAYSAPMKEFSQGGSVPWDYEHLSNFLLAPKSYIRGTAMSFPGLKKPEERANVIAYLRSLSASPAPLPDPAAAPAVDAAAPAGEQAAPAADAPAAEGASPAATEGAAPADAAPATAPAAPAGEAPAQEDGDGTNPAPTGQQAPAAEPAAPAATTPLVTEPAN